MTDDASIDLSDQEFFEEQLQIVSLISDMILEFSDVSSLEPDEREAMRAAMDEVAVAILAELDFVIVSANGDGTVTARLRPAGIES